MGNNSFEITNSLKDIKWVVPFPQLRTAIVETYAQQGKGTDLGIEVSKNVINLIRIFIVHLLIGSFYILGTIIIAIGFAIDIINFLPNTLEDKIWVFLTFCTMSILLYINPLLKHFGNTKITGVIDKSVSKTFEFIDKFINYSIYIIGEIVGFIIMSIYIFCLNDLNRQYFGFNVIWFNMVTIFIYIVIASRYIARLLHFFDKQWFVDKDIIFSINIHKNSNYLGLVILTLIAYADGNYDSEIIYAFAVVFVFDSYWKNRRDIIRNEE